jgi:hypothetical protein
MQMQLYRIAQELPRLMFADFPERFLKWQYLAIALHPLFVALLLGLLMFLMTMQKTLGRIY